MRGPRDLIRRAANKHDRLGGCGGRIVAEGPPAAAAIGHAGPLAKPNLWHRPPVVAAGDGAGHDQRAVLIDPDGAGDHGRRVHLDPVKVVRVIGVDGGGPAAGGLVEDQVDGALLEAQQATDPGTRGEVNRHVRPPRFGGIAREALDLRLNDELGRHGQVAVVVQRVIGWSRGLDEQVCTCKDRLDWRNGVVVPQHHRWVNLIGIDSPGRPPEVLGSVGLQEGRQIKNYERAGPDN